MRDLRGEDGAVAVLFSILMMLMVGLVALALELGALRVDRRNAQSTADMASTAGALALQAVENGVVTGNPQEACDTAWAYFLANTPDADPTSGSGNPCGSFPTDPDLCDPGNPSEALGTADPYAIRILWPVPDDDVMMDSRTYDTDGDPCERLGVQISRLRGFIFGSVFGDPDAVTGAPAVSKSEIGETSEEIASLLLLDKIGCQLIDASGGGELRATAVLHPGDDGVAGTADDEWIPGRIHADSDTSGCTGQDTVVDVDGGGYIVADGDGNDPPAPGQIRLFEMPGSTCQIHWCDPGDIMTAPPPAHPGDPGPGIWPQPNPLPQQTNRTPADHTFNCRSETDFGSDPYAYLDPEIPNAGDHPDGWDVPACTKGTPNYVDRLETALGDGGTMPAGYQRWTDHFDSCGGGAAPLDDPPLDIAALSGNWYVDCPGPNGFQIAAGETVNFVDGNVVFTGPVKNTGGDLGFNIAGTGTLSDPCDTAACFVHQSSPGASLVYMAAGDLDQGGGSLTLDHTLVFMRNGAAKITGGSYSWIAPNEGPFEDLAYWSDRSPPNANKPDRTQFRGSGTTTMEGVYFAPNSVVEITGGAGSTPKKAQFFTWRLRVAGGGAVVLEPAPDRGLPIPIFEGVSLIR